MRYRLRTLLILMAVGSPMLYVAWVYFPLVALGTTVAALEVPLFIVPPLCFVLWRRGLLNARRFLITVAIATTILTPALMAFGSHKFHLWLETAVMP